MKGKEKRKTRRRAGEKIIILQNTKTREMQRKIILQVFEIKAESLLAADDMLLAYLYGIEGRFGRVNVNKLSSEMKAGN